MDEDLMSMLFRTLYCLERYDRFFQGELIRGADTYVV